MRCKTFFNGNNQIKEAAKNFFRKLNYPVEYSYNNTREYDMGLFIHCFRYFFLMEIFLTMITIKR